MNEFDTKVEDDVIKTILEKGEAQHGSVCLPLPSCIHELSKQRLTLPYPAVNGEDRS